MKEPLPNFEAGKKIQHENKTRWKKYAEDERRHREDLDKLNWWRSIRNGNFFVVWILKVNEVVFAFLTLGLVIVASLLFMFGWKKIGNEPIENVLLCSTAFVAVISSYYPKEYSGAKWTSYGVLLYLVGMSWWRIAEQFTFNEAGWTTIFFLVWIVSFKLSKYRKITRS